MLDHNSNAEGRHLWERANRMLPRDQLYLSRSAEMVERRSVLPGLIAHANGCRVTDVARCSCMSLRVDSVNFWVRRSTAETDKGAKIQVPDYYEPIA